jgi:hypothetical protein
MSDETAREGSQDALAEKRRRAAELRIAGATYEQIARQLGYSGVSGAFAAVEEGLRDAFAEPNSDIRRLELDRLDALLLGLWPQARKGNLGAIDRALKIMERRARYLGLDKNADTGLQTGTGDGKIVSIKEARANRKRPASG